MRTENGRKDYCRFFFKRNQFFTGYSENLCRLNEEYERAFDRYRRLAEIGERFESEIALSPIEGILFYLAEGDLSKYGALRKMESKRIYNWYYLNRINDLHELSDAVNRMEKTR